MTAFTFRDLAFVSGRRLLYPNYVQDYLDRVTAADVAAGNTLGLELGVTDAFNTCLQALVADGILGVSGGVLAQAASLIKASCAMQGARTLPGALVPLAADMPAPTNVGPFVAGDYSRRTGLGDPANVSKHLNSNYAFPTSLQNNCSMAMFSSVDGTTGIEMGWVDLSGTGSFLSSATSRLYNTGGSTFFPSDTTATGFRAISRASSASFTYRRAGANETASITSSAVTHEAMGVLARRRQSSVVDSFSNARLNFYSFASALDLAILDTRITALSNAIQAAIP